MVLSSLCVVDAASIEYVRIQRESTTSIEILLAGIAIIYKLKTQTQTALSSPKA